MKTITIDRSRWICDMLTPLNPNMKTGCALGHAIRQTRHCAWKEVDDIHDAINVTACDKILGGELLSPLEKLVYKSIVPNINDEVQKHNEKFTKSLTPRKEKDLKTEFKKFGFNLKFTGKRPAYIYE